MAVDIPATYEGAWTHWLCGACECVIWIEDDVGNDVVVECDACGQVLITEGKP